MLVFIKIELRDEMQIATIYISIDEGYVIPMGWSIRDINLPYYADMGAEVERLSKLGVYNY